MTADFELDDHEQQTLALLEGTRRPVVSADLAARIEAAINAPAGIHDPRALFDVYAVDALVFLERLLGDEVVALSVLEEVFAGVCADETPDLSWSGLLYRTREAGLKTHRRMKKSGRESAALADGARRVVLDDADGSWVRVQERVRWMRTRRDAVSRTQAAIKLRCLFCHDAAAQQDLVYCASCLTPHHADCFAEHGSCSAPGCGEPRTVRPLGHAVAPSPRRWARPAARWGGLVTIVAGGVLAAAAWSEPLTVVFSPPQVSFADEEEDYDDERPTFDPAQLTLPAPPLLAMPAEPEKQALRALLERKRVSLNFDQTPILEAIQFFRDVTGLNFVVSADARDLIENESVEVSLRVRDIQLGNAIQLVLASHESLSCSTRDGLICVDTVERPSAPELQLEFYEVGDLLDGSARARGPGASLNGDQFLELLGRCMPEFDGSVEIGRHVLIARLLPADHAKVRELINHLRHGVTRPADAEPRWIGEARAVLASKVLDFDVRGQTLAHAMNSFQTLTGLSVVVSPTVDAEDTLVTLSVKGLPARDVLDLLLQQVDLACAFENECLVVTQPEEARAECVFRFLDVQDLVGTYTDREAGGEWLDPDQLVEIVTSATGKDNWDDPAWIQCHRGQIFIQQTRSVLAEIETLIAKMRAVPRRERSSEAR